jgi:hypothetical protein
MSRRDPLEGVPSPSRRPAPSVDPHQDEIRRRQRSRALVMALALGAFVVLVYFITIAKMSMQ